MLLNLMETYDTSFGLQYNKSTWFPYNSTENYYPGYARLLVSKIQKPIMNIKQLI